MKKLESYKAKRKLKETHEPKPIVSSSKGKLKFVVHKHEASHLHYDLRLELEGVLKSWAIPKGPSMDPSEKRLAIIVEDHPLEYRSFEGIIPEGHYGAGKVIIWDKGTYLAPNAKTRKESEDLLKAGLKKGHLEFILEGKKLKGIFDLVKINLQDQKNTWLLIKKKEKTS